MATSAPSTSNRLWDMFDDLVRFLKKKIAAIDLFDETMPEKPATSPWYALGSMVYLFWIICIVTGLILIMWYIPNTARAYDSIIRIKDEIPLGWLIRGCHKYGADALIIAATMRIYRLYFTGEYKTRELAWAVSILILVVGMFSGLTGYLLMWNQRAFWASKVFATFPTYLDQIPLVDRTHFGMMQAQFMLGGTAIGEATLTRFYAGHFMLSMFSLIVVEAYFIRKGLRRINLTWFSIAICILMLVLTTMFVPVLLGERANRAETPLPILSDWYFLGLYQMMKEMKPLYAVIGTVFIPLFALLMPAFDQAKDVPTWRRPFFLMVGVAAFIYWLILSFMIILDYAQIAIDPPIVWGSFTLMLLCGACWEFRQLAFPRAQVLKRCGYVFAGWILLILIFAGWTRFRLPDYAPTYYPAAMSKVIPLEDSKQRDEMNARYRGDNPDAVMDDLLNCLRRPFVTEWYAPSQEQADKLLAAHATVRGWWVMMTVILLFCAFLAVITTPVGGIEPYIWTLRTERGRRIKGIRDEDKDKPQA